MNAFKTAAWSAAAVSWAFAAPGEISFPLEWNATYRTDVPYEVEVSPAKLGADVFTVMADGTPLETDVLRGNRPGTVAVRFSVPAGTRELQCVGRSGGRSPVPSEGVFSEALADPAGWTFDTAGKGRPAVAVTKLAQGGLRFVNRGGTAWATFATPVPDGLAGKPVKLELDCVSRTPMTWGGMIRVAQYDAEGRLLPESLSDPRWTSHMRPCDKVTAYRERGRVHPQARRLELRIELRVNRVSIDNYGLPLKDRDATVPVLDLTHVSVRPAAELPFPKWNDAFFADGPSGRPEDRAIVLGGERAFWFQTRSQASWAEARQLRDESQVFFPSAAGTVEAWFRPTAFARSGQVMLMEAAHHGARKAVDAEGRASTYNENRGTILGVACRPREGQVVVTLKDAADKVFEKTTSWRMPLNEWTHLALAWRPEGEAALFANGKRILSMPLAGYRPQDLVRAELPNSFGATEFYLGSSYRSARVSERKDARYPFFEGAADGLRISSVPRYSSDFTPATAFACDADTRALFGFDRTFDGVSGGGVGWISGCVRDFVDRVSHELRVRNSGGVTTVQYYPRDVLPEADPTKVLDINNYPHLPTPEDFDAARRFRSRTQAMKPGETMRIDAPDGVFTEFVEFANESDGPLLYPALVRTGEIDPRSFGDISDSLLAGGRLSDRERANRVFQFVLGASDYFMNHQPIFKPGSDVPQSVEYEALMMLNGYCGFECGPLNNLAANMFACAGGCPAGQTAGYGHSFEQVFYDGKNHIYDLSAQQFFAAMDNETAAYLEEDAEQPGCHYRIGKSADHFIRNATRAAYVQSPAFQKKVAMVLNPGESFRMWFVNDGACNDLQYNSCYCGNRREAPSGVRRETLSPYQENYEAQTHAKCDKQARVRGLPPDLNRIDRFFPHYANGFLRFAGRPRAANPAFVNVADDSFCYRVASAYPIVAAEYAARRADGTAVPLEICTDWREYRPLALDADGVARLDYLVRARMEYWIRVRAPMDQVAEFASSTEVMANARIFPGKLTAGSNELRYRGANPARVTLGWSERDKPMSFEGALETGVIPGVERALVVLDPEKGVRTVKVTNCSASARVRASAGLTASLSGGSLVLEARAKRGSVEFVSVQDGEAVKTLTVVVCPRAQLVTADAAKLSGGATRKPKAGDCRQTAAVLKSPADAASFPVAELGDGAWCVWNLTRWESHRQDPKNRLLQMASPSAGLEPVVAAGPINSGLMFYKAQYGRKGGRAQWKWDHVIDPHSYYPYPLVRRMLLKGARSLDFSLRDKVPAGVEVAAVLVMPFPEQAFKCQLLKALGGLNYDPFRMRP